jgi:hypothetical protein
MGVTPLAPQSTGLHGGRRSRALFSARSAFPETSSVRHACAANRPRERQFRGALSGVAECPTQSGRPVSLSTQHDGTPGRTKLERPGSRSPRGAGRVGRYPTWGMVHAPSMRPQWSVLGVQYAACSGADASHDTSVIAQRQTRQNAELFAMTFASDTAHHLRLRPQSARFASTFSGCSRAILSRKSSRSRCRPSSATNRASVRCGVLSSAAAAVRLPSQFSTARRMISRAFCGSNMTAAPNGVTRGMATHLARGGPIMKNESRGG